MFRMLVFFKSILLLKYLLCRSRYRYFYIYVIRYIQKFHIFVAIIFFQTNLRSFLFLTVAIEIYFYIINK